MAQDFLKMALIRDEELKRLRARQITSYDPNLRSIVEKEDAKTSVLLDEDMPADEKMARMDIIDSHEMNAKKNFGLPASGLSKVRKRPLSTAEHVEEAEEEVPRVHRAFRGLPQKRARRQIARVKSAITDSNIIDTSEKGELIYRGEVLPESDFNSLVHWLWEPGKQPSPQGNLTFIRALHESGISEKDVANPAAKHAFQIFSQGSSRSTSALTPTIGRPKPLKFDSDPQSGDGKKSKSSSAPQYSSFMRKHTLPPGIPFQYHHPRILLAYPKH